MTRGNSGFVVTSSELSLPGFSLRSAGGFRFYTAATDRYGDAVVLRENARYLMVLVGSVFGYAPDALFERLCAAFERLPAELDRLNGEYAFVLLDKTGGELAAACDKIGHQELYAKSVGGQIALFPDLALLQHQKPNRFSNLGVSLFLKFRYPLPPATFFEAVSVLPGGCLWRFRSPSAAVRHERYWRPSKKYDIRDEREYAPLLAGKITDSCRNRSCAGVNPMFLSGGLDSASVLYGLMKAERRVDAGFIVFPGYVVQERFADVAERLAAETRTPFHRMQYSWSDPNAWEDVLDGVRDAYSTYCTQAAFIRYLKTNGDAKGNGRSFFWGESADGLFGLNLTFEDDEDRYLGINRNMIRSAKFYAGKLSASAAGGAAARMLLDATALLNRVVAIPGVSSRLPFATTWLDRYVDFQNYMLGYYYNPAVLPGFSSHHLRHAQLTRAGLEQQIDFFRREYLDDAAIHYERGGVGEASKALIFRLENLSIDIRMKRATGVIGMRPVFPLYDADVCEVLYSIPNNQFVFSRDRRPKHPLRDTVRREFRAPEWLLSEKKTADHPNVINPEHESFRAIKEQFMDYTARCSFARGLDAAVFRLESINPRQVTRFADAMPLVVLEHLARDYC